MEGGGGGWITSLEALMSYEIKKEREMKYMSCCDTTLTYSICVPQKKDLAALVRAHVPLANASIFPPACRHKNNYPRVTPRQTPPQ